MQSNRTSALARRCALVLAGVALVGVAAAHHSVAAFNLATDARKTVSGTVKKFEWQNPHAWIWIDVPKADGTVDQWGGEMSSLGALRNAGMTWNSVQAGQKISLLLAPNRDGRNSGLVLKITWEDGHSWEPSGGASPLPPSGQQAPGQRAGESVQNAPPAR